MTTAASTAYRGWFRLTRRHRWRAMSEHADYGRCLDLLLNAVARIPGHHELLVSVNDPNDDKPIPARRRF